MQLLYTSFALLLILFFPCFITSLAITNYYTDQSALLEFKTRYITSDPRSILASNWSTSNSICDWFGVTCGARHRRVVGLNLTHMELVGTIAPHLGNLSFLVSFDIKSNHFHGDLPKELGDLRRLRLFGIDSNEFGGEFPSWVTNISTLEYLYLSTNSFTGQMPTEIGNLVRLRVLALDENKFTGRIPRSIGNLTALQEVYLGLNNLEGEIPWELGNLVNLEEMIIGGRGLVGALPSSIFNISSLQALAVSNSSITDSLPNDICSHLPRLEALELADNKLTGKIPNSIGNCSSLELAYLFYNGFTGEIPREMGSLPIQVLYLQHNRLRGSIPSTIFNSSTLVNIELSMNNLSGQLPSNIGALTPNLELLGLSENKLKGTIPSSISNASKLSSLDLISNSLSGFIPTTLGNLRQLEWLNLASNSLTVGSTSWSTSLFSSLSNCVKLTYLALGDNPLNCILPSSIGNFSSSLQKLFLYESRISGDLPPQIGNLSGVILISFEKNKFGGEIPKTLGQLEELQYLVLAGNHFRGQIPNALCHLQKIGTLALKSNSLEGPVPLCLGNMTSLRYLHLDSNKLNSTIPSSMFTLEYMLQLMLSDNAMSGSLPPEIENMKVLTTIDFSRNNLSGNIPISIGSLQNLAFLSLSKNGFQGPIPESLGKMIGLETLDLSENNLVGEIPKSLEALLHLKAFNVSFNRLQGKIPDGGCFKNFTAQSFMSNLALCGSPQFQVQPCKPSTGIERSKLTKLLLKCLVPSVTGVILILVLLFLFNHHRDRRKGASGKDDVLDPPTWRTVTYYELKQATKGFSEANLLGSGSFGSVYKGLLLDGTSIAVKVFNLQLEGAYESFETESKLLANIRHRNLIKIISCCSNTDFKALVLEYMSNGSLEQWLYSGDRFLNLFQRLDIMIDVASALEYLHYGYSTPIVHCDLKPSNILLDEDIVAHVADFGLTKLLNGVDAFTRTMTLATIGYMAPEYGSDGVVSIKGDVYSFGILLMETFTRMKPTNEMFVGENSLPNWMKVSLPHQVPEIADEYLLSEDRKDSGAIVECMSAILELALACTRESPEDRLKMNHVLATLKKIKVKYLVPTRTWRN